MEPEGDIDKHADDVEQYALQFAGVKELNYLWVRSKKDKTKECYDDLACMCLEWNYWQYMKGGASKDKYRFVHFVPNTIVDLECYCETDVAFNDTGVDSERQGEADDALEIGEAKLKKSRPYSLFKALRPEIKS